MPDRLVVSTDGLVAASAALNEHASQLASAAGTPGGCKPSGVGATALAASTAAFMEAYAARIAGHGQSAQAAAGSYITTDDGAADTAREAAYGDRGIVYLAADHKRDMAKFADRPRILFARATRRSR